jgi:hypothetical protein
MPRRAILAASALFVLMLPGAAWAAGPPTGAAAHRPLVPAPDLLRNGKAAAARDRAPAAPGPGPAPQAVVVAGRNQPGLGATDNSAANQGSPPDATGAVGPAHYVEMVNSKVGVYDRDDLSLVSSRDLDAFTASTGDDVFDPQIQWDRQANRWLYVAVKISGSSNFLDFGWSKTADPTDLVNGWCRFHQPTTSRVEDYPKLGHDDLHILIGTNSFLGNSFETAHIFSMPKPPNGTTTCTMPSPISVFGSPSSPLTTSDGTIVFTPVPANTANSSAAGHVVAADSPFFVGSPNQIMAWHVGGTATAPTLIPDGNMNVTPFAFPANVPQPSTSRVLDSSDTRLTQAVSTADPSAGGAQAVWTQHTVNGPGGRSVVRWYELLPASLTVRQLGTIQDPALFAFNGAISPASNGTTAAINYNTGSASQLVRIKAQSRLITTPLNQMTGETELGVSVATDQDFSCFPPNGPPCRWGDYAGASPDPNDSQAIWGSNQLNGPLTSDPAWTTRNFQITDSLAGYVRPKGATPFRASLVPAYQACTAANRTHGAPLSFGSCAPPAQHSGFLTVGTPDANGLSTQAIAWVQMRAVPGDSGTGTDEADVQLAASSTDVRLSSGLADYTGELQARVDLQVTDRSSGPGADEPATLQVFSYRFAVPCQATVSTTVGGSCAVTTTADALVAGTVKEEVRTVWQLDAVRLFDGGGDGVASTEPNSLFETQGVFVP